MIQYNKLDGPLINLYVYVIDHSDPKAILYIDGIRVKGTEQEIAV